MIKELTDLLLEKSYRKAAGAMLSQIAAILRNRNSAMQKSLSKLDDEAQRLEDEKERMAVSNAQLEQTLGEYRSAAKTTQNLILANDNDIQLAGQLLAIPVVTAKVFSQLSEELIADGKNPLTSMPLFQRAIEITGLPYDIPDAEDFVSGFISTPAWIDKMNKWGDGYADLTEKTIMSGVRQGWGPRRVATEMRKHAENIPLSAAENLTRTLQVTSFREASLEVERINGEYIIKKIRVATLNDATCLSCISLHGTELQPGERVDDHYRGRCSEFYVVPGGPELPGQMQADSRPGSRQFIPFQKGEDWFSSLPTSRQRQQASFLNTPAKWKAFQDGTPLSAFVHDHNDDVFGNQIVENSLIGALGDDAEQFYSKSQ